MEQVILENEELSVRVESGGAQLVSIYDKKKEREVLWEGDPAVWNRHAPILFPFIGNCYRHQYLHQGTVRPMKAHGFARDMEHRLSGRTENEVWFELTDDEGTRESYPFSFDLQTGHRLNGRTVEVLWKVQNTGAETMYFMIGGHPAFRTPKGMTIYDYTLDFGKTESLHFEAPDEDGYADPKREGTLTLAGGKAEIVPGFFDRALTYIFDGGQIETVSLLAGGEPYVTMNIKGFPYLGVWTMEKTHPFICLEPWYGRCADLGFEGELRDRQGIVALEPGREFSASYTIEIH